MEKVLRVELNDRFLAEDRKNQIVLFKSCYPNNEFTGVGTPPGDPAGPDLTLLNAKAALGVAPRIREATGGPLRLRDSASPRVQIAKRASWKVDREEDTWEARRSGPGGTLQLDRQGIQRLGQIVRGMAEG